MGATLLIDVAWVHELSGFILGEPHFLGFFDIILVTRGKGAFWLDSHRHAVHPGGVLHHPGQVRRWDVRQLDGVCLFFEDFFIKEFLHDDAFLVRLPYFHADPSRAAMSLAPAAARRMRTRLAAMHASCPRPARQRRSLARAAVRDAHRAGSPVRGGASCRSAASNPSRRLEIHRLVERDAARRHRIADYAAELAVTPGHLSVLWHSTRASAPSGCSTARSRRVRAGCFSTPTSRPLASAASLGFEDPSYFSRFFRRNRPDPKGVSECPPWPKGVAGTSVLGVGSKTGGRGGLGAGQHRVQTVPNRAIRLGLVTVQKALVVLVKLGFQHSQPVKFREEYSRRFGRRAHRILGVVVLPGKKHLMRLVEIKVVEQAKPLIERSANRRCIGRSRGHQQGRQAQAPERTARVTDRLLTFIVVSGKPQYCACLPSALQLT